MIFVHIGPMFAQKTTALVRAYRMADALGLSPKALMPSVLARSGATFTTHDGDSVDAELVHNAEGLLASLCTNPITLMDEAQAMDSVELGGALSAWLNQRAARGHKSIVVLAGLDFDALGRSFPWVDIVRALGASVHTHTAICEVCGMQATRTVAILSETRQAIANGEDVIGGAELYSPRCLDHLDV